MRAVRQQGRWRWDRRTQLLLLFAVAPCPCLVAAAACPDIVVPGLKYLSTTPWLSAGVVSVQLRHPLPQQGKVSFKPRPLYLRVGLWAGLDTAKKRNVSCICRESNAQLSDCLASSLVAIPVGLFRHLLSRYCLKLGHNHYHANHSHSSIHPTTWLYSTSKHTLSQVWQRMWDRAVWQKYQICCIYDLFNDAVSGLDHERSLSTELKSMWKEVVVAYRTVILVFAWRDWRKQGNMIVRTTVLQVEIRSGCFGEKSTFRNEKYCHHFTAVFSSLIVGMRKWICRSHIKLSMAV